MFDVKEVMDGVDDKNITSILNVWKDISLLKKNVEKCEEELKNKIKVFLKERRWDRYKDDETNISVTMSTMSREVIDKNQLKIMLTDSQMAQVIRVTSFEKLSIITPEARKRINKIMSNNI